MFSSPFAASRGPSASAYREVGTVTAIDGASPHKLVSLLYAGLANQIAVARGAIARGDVAGKCRAISHAARILEEGLIAPLDMEAGGAIAVNLRDLYEYLVQRLTIANLRSDDAVLDECSRVLQTLREGWDGMADQVAQPVRQPVAV